MPDAFTTKWLGIIDLSRKRMENAAKYLNMSVNLKGDDAQVLFNLAGAYAMENKFEKAYDAINRCLEIDSEFPGALNLKRQIVVILKK